jgi:hypothetical protein
MLDLVEEALDQIAFPVDVLVVWDGLRPGAGRWNHGFCAGFCDASAKPISVVAFVGQMIEGYAADQILDLEDVVHLASCQDEANGIAKRIYARTDLRAQAAARTPDRLSSLPLLRRPHAGGSNHGGVDDQVFEVLIFDQRIENASERLADCIEMVQPFLETEVGKVVGAEFVAQERRELLILLEEGTLEIGAEVAMLDLIDNGGELHGACGAGGCRKSR